MWSVLLDFKLKSRMNKKQRDLILELILQQYPDKKIELDFETPFQLLMAVMLSAQMTDVWVNKATPKLFEQVKEPKDILELDISEIAEMIRSINYFNTKAKHVYQTWKILHEEYEWKIPDNLKDLTSLPGVGIKTAKVVLSHLYNMPMIWVDTHIHRVMNRMQIVNTKTPEQTDAMLEKLLSDEQKRTLHHAIVLFGRYICKASWCTCSETPLAPYCMCETCKEKRKNIRN